MRHDGWEEGVLLDDTREVAPILDLLGSIIEGIFVDFVAHRSGSHAEGFEHCYPRPHQRRERASKAGNGDLGNDIVDFWYLENDGVEPEFACWCLDIATEEVYPCTERSNDKDPILDDKRAQSEHKLGNGGQLGVRPTEATHDAADLRNNKDHQAKKCGNGDNDEHGGVCHGAFDFFAHTGVFFLLHGQAFEDVIKNTSCLTRAHHVDKNGVEGFWVLFECVGECHTALDIAQQITCHHLEGFATGVVVQRTHGAQQRHTSRHHGTELAGKHYQVFTLDFVATKESKAGALWLNLFSTNWSQALAAQAR